MADTNDSAVETLQPEDFAVFGGYDFKDGQQRSLWLLGPDVITSFGMEVDNVDITVHEGGFLKIEPRERKGCIGGFGAGQGFWARTSELQLEAA